MQADEFLKLNNFLAIDEKGQFHAQGVAVSDPEAGYELLQNVEKVDGIDRYVTRMEDHKAIIEFFDAIYIATGIAKLSDELFEISMPYDFKDQFHIKDLSVDEWDRFHGHSIRGIPFVLTDSAQNDFFNLLESFDDDSITLAGKQYTLPIWPATAVEDDNHHNPQAWSERYENENTPWDLGEGHVSLKDILPQIKLGKSRILVLGCGRGHDAAYLAEQGHLVTAVDYSETALQVASQHYGHIKNLSFIKADALDLPESFHKQFDVVFEHTLYCAIQPKHRNQLLNNWKKVLIDGGHLLSVFFCMDRPHGPPYGGSEWEIRKRLQGHFEPLYWTRWKNSKGRRKAMELIVYAQKK